MLYQLISKLNSARPLPTVSAHCDVPCGIYDPIPAQIAAMTVARMTDTLVELEEHEKSAHDSNRDHHYANKLSRMVSEKERSASIVKEEVHIIWGDFFKPNHFEGNPAIHTICHEVMMIASKCKQNIDVEASRMLVEKTNEFARLF